MLDLLHNRLHLALFISNGFSMALLSTRFIFTGSMTYAFLIWNLFLAAVPYAVILVCKANSIGPRRLIFWPLMALWFLFLPNAPYIITDFLHLQRATAGSVWYDSLLILTFAFNGLVLFFLAFKPVQAMVASRYGVLPTWLFVACIVAFSAFGMYLGRYERFNSWDVILNLPMLLGEIVDRFVHPLSHLRTWSMTALYSGFLLVTYYVMWTLTRQSIGVKS